MNVKESNGWSEALRLQTLEYIRQAIISPLDGNLHFKHWSDGAAFITFENLCREKLVLIDKRDGQRMEFGSAEDLVNAGWAID